MITRRQTIVGSIALIAGMGIDGPKPAKSMNVCSPQVIRRSRPLDGQTVALRDYCSADGRGSDAAIILDDDYASTRHARIAVSGDQWFVEDLGSTNGTYIGSVRINQPTAISLGTQVRIGKTILELRK